MKRDDPRWWDSFYVGLAEYIASASKDPSTRCGAVIARPNRTIAGLGFNGFPRRVPDRPGDYADREVKLARVIHAEQNAILNTRESLDGYAIYVWPMSPCDRCAAHIVQAGIARVVFRQLEVQRWTESFRHARAIFADAGVEVVDLA